MSFVHITGDIFTTSSPYIGHGVNTMGIMGSGIARIIADRWPALEEEYMEACETNALAPGSVLFIDVEREGHEQTVIANMSSQILPGANASMDLLRDSLNETLDRIQAAGGRSLAVPRIGAGVGGLEWDDVRELLESTGKSRGDSFTLEIWSLPGA